MIDEIEILRGRGGIRVTTGTATVGRNDISIRQITAVALMTASGSPFWIVLACMLLCPSVGLWAAFTLREVFEPYVWVPAMVVWTLWILIIGLDALGTTCTHRVRVQTNRGFTTTLYRTANLADARLFLAAIEVAMDMTKQTGSETGRDESSRTGD